MALIFDSYFDKAPAFLSPWKYVPDTAPAKPTERWSKWSPIFRSNGGSPFQVRVNLDSHLVEFSVEGIALTDAPLDQVSKYMKEVLNDNPVS